MAFLFFQNFVILAQNFQKIGRLLQNPLFRIKKLEYVKLPVIFNHKFQTDMSIFAPPMTVITVEWHYVKTLYRIFAFIYVYQSQIHHWNPETKLNQKMFFIQNFECQNLSFFTFFDLNLRSNCKITVVILFYVINHHVSPNMCRTTFM